MYFRGSNMTRSLVRSYSKLPAKKSLHQQHNDYSLQLNRWFLKPIGIWPASTSTEKILSHAIQFICYSLITFTVIPSVLYIFLEDQDVDIRVKAIGPVSHWMMGILNYLSLLLRGDEIRRCIEHMEVDWQLVNRAEDREVMLKSAKFGRFVAGFCAVFMHCGVFSYSMMKGMSSLVIVIDNQTVTIPRLPCPFYSNFLDTTVKLTNQIVLMIQFLSGFIVNSITVGACSLAAVFAMHACGQFNVLFLWLNELVGDDGEEERKLVEYKLANIVQHHLRVLSFVSRIEQVMYQICLVQLVGCTLNMCMLGYYSLTEWNTEDTKNLVTYGILFVSITFNIFIFCYIGELLSEQCKKVGETAYLTEWYRLPQKTALSLVLIISRSSAVIKMTAGKLIELSLITFGDVIKTSLAYLNILRTVSL
ncbi:odorant receptor 4-like isoform X2 [Harpegnathos saltator]|uniref:odorant receptor 4-like isoform X2 n=1 Tax=Harpegnathos saltator TaxID=610380 RepID=UPI000948DA36|nr:odorant receptor 4-like isoform X2 [Harpegnathos saltator]